MQSGGGPCSQMGARRLPCSQMMGARRWPVLLTALDCQGHGERDCAPSRAHSVGLGLRLVKRALGFTGTAPRQKGALALRLDSRLDCALALRLDSPLSTAP